MQNRIIGENKSIIGSGLVLLCFLLYTDKEMYVVTGNMQIIQDITATVMQFGINMQLLHLTYIYLPN